MGLVKVVEGKPLFDPIVYTIPEYKAIIDRSSEETALKELSYVYFMEDYRSYFKQKFPDEEQEAERANAVLDLLQLKKWKEDDVVKEARQRYKTPYMAVDNALDLTIYNAALRAANHLINYFNEVDYDEAKTERGKRVLVHQPEDIMKKLKAVGEVVKGLKKARDDASIGVMATDKIYGGGEVGIFEDPEDE